MRKLLMKRGVASLAAMLIATVAHGADSLEVGTMHVQTHGDHGSPVILIPGLGTGGWVWDEVVEPLKRDHVLYVVTLAGFDGTPAVKGKLMERAGESLLELIRTQHLEKPVIVGHSLGGTLAIQFAQTHGDLLAGVVAVDGLPVLPGTENLPAPQRAAVAENLRKQMVAMTAEQFAAQQLQYMKTIGVIDPEKAKAMADRTARSDPAATAQYIAEDLALDLRPGLASIPVPVMEVVPFNEKDHLPGQPATEAEKVAYYTKLLQGTPKLEVIAIAPARHFVMTDQPTKFVDALQGFLAKVKADGPSTQSTTQSSAPH